MAFQSGDLGRGQVGRSDGWAVMKATIAQVRQRVGEDDLGERSAIVKGIQSDGCNQGVRQLDAFDPSATPKGPILNRAQRGGEDDLVYVILIPVRIRCDCGGARGDRHYAASHALLRMRVRQCTRCYCFYKSTARLRMRVRQCRRACTSNLEKNELVRIFLIIVLLIK